MSNIPTGADHENAPFNQKKSWMELCEQCGGSGTTLANNEDQTGIVCPNCKGEGEVEMTTEEIRDKIEAKKENQHRHDL